jgi:hypothetical protein
MPSPSRLEVGCRLVLVLVLLTCRGCKVYFLFSLLLVLERKKRIQVQHESSGEWECQMLVIVLFLVIFGGLCQQTFDIFASKTPSNSIL